MSAPTHSSKKPPQANAAAGPVVFFGLIVYVLLSQNPTAPDYQNPAEIMDTNAIARSAEVTMPDAPLPVETRYAQVDDAIADDSGVQLARFDAPGTPPAPQNPLILPPFAGPLGPGGSGYPAIAAAEHDALNFDSPDAVPVLARLSAPAAFFKTVLPENPQLATLSELVEVTGEAVNLRQDPNVSAAQIAQFDSGAIGMRVGQTGGWSHVNFLFQSPPITGWMASRYLVPLQQ